MGYGLFDGEDGQALGGEGDGEGAVGEVGLLGWGEFAGGLEVGDLFAGGGGGAAHGVVGLDDVAVVGVELPELDGGGGGDALEGQLDGLRGAGGGGRRGVGGAFAVGGSVVPESKGEGAVGGACGDDVVGFGGDGEALCAEVVEHGEGIEGGLGDAVFGEDAEAAVEGGADDALLFEDVGEGPVAHALCEAVALVDGGGEPGAHVDGVGDVGLVGVAGVVLGEDERELGVGGLEDLLVDLGDGAADHLVAGNVLVGVEHVVGGVVAVNVGADEVDGDVCLLDVGEEVGNPAGLGGGGAADDEAFVTALRARAVWS